MKYPVGTKVREKPAPIAEIDKVRTRGKNIQYHINGNQDWRWYSEEQITEWFDVVEGD